LRELLWGILPHHENATFIAKSYNWRAARRRAAAARPTTFGEPAAGDKDAALGVQGAMMARAVLYGRPLLARQVCVGPFALESACPGVIGHLASSVSVRGEWLLALKVLIYYWRPVYVFSNTWTHCFHVRLSVVCAPGLATGLHRASCPRRDTRHQRS
jgi:hypothetical protein